MRILFTGGGTAGHVTPNLALIEVAREKGWQMLYVGTKSGIEREMIGRVGIDYHPIASGKLRRYFSWQNFIDPFRILWGLVQSVWICVRQKPDLVFSKGGFVAVPVVVAAWLLRIPVISHESDVTPGLANRLTYPFCRKICVTFEETTRHLPLKKTVCTGTPVRNALLRGDPAAGVSFLGLGSDKPLLLVFGGSLGAQVINHQIRSVLPALLIVFNIVHVVGRGNVATLAATPGYVQKEFIDEGFGDVLAAASVVVSRAGANSLYELIATRTPHLLIPLSRAASRGDQIVNASTFSAKGFSLVLEEAQLTDERFLEAVFSLYEDRDVYGQQMQTYEVKDSVELIFAEIQGVLRDG